MSANQSNLSEAKYDGYDFVVATTQRSINATMKEYFYNMSPSMTRIYWNQNKQGHPVRVDHDDLMKQTNGTDPLNVPSWSDGDPKTPDITNLSSPGCEFYFAMEAAMGIPDGMAAGDIPDIVTFTDDNKQIIFNLLCSEFKIVSCEFSRAGGLLSLTNVSQPKDKPWIFSFAINLKDIYDPASISDAVKNQLDNIGWKDFSVQALVLDLDNAASHSTPEIEGVPASSDAYDEITKVFTRQYLDEIKSQGSPVLNYTILKNSAAPAKPTLTLSSMAIEVNPYSPPAGKPANNNLSTLNYLCSTNSKQPDPVKFGWNWLEEEDASKFDGVISVRKGDFVSYLSGIFSPKLSDLNFVPSLSVVHNGQVIQTTWDYSFKDEAGVSFGIPSPPSPPDDGYAKILTFSKPNHSKDEAYTDAHLIHGYGEFNYDVYVDVWVKGGTIKVVTRATIYMSYEERIFGGKTLSDSGNPIDYTSTVLYEMAVTESGTLKVTETVRPMQDNSKDFSTSALESSCAKPFFDSLNKIKDQIEPKVKQAMTTFSDDIANTLNGYRAWVFPGGKTFAFKDIQFSDNQDLTSKIIYLATS